MKSDEIIQVFQSIIYPLKDLRITIYSSLNMNSYEIRVSFTHGDQFIYITNYIPYEETLKVYKYLAEQTNVQLEPYYKAIKFDGDIKDLLS